MKKLISMVLAAVMVLSLCACGSSAKGGSDLKYIKDKGTLIVGITDFEPMDYKNDAGEWIGFDADMAKAFAQSLGVKAEFIEIDWDNKILELNNKSIDVVWNGMTLTDEVTKSMSCGDAYCNNAQVVVVKAADASKYQTKESLSGLAFAVEAGSAGEDAVKELGLQPTAVQTQAAALMEVQAGTADACVIDLLMAGAMIGEGTSYPELTYTVELTSEEYGCGFRKDGDMAKAYNDFYKKAYADGTVEKIAKEYGVQESIIPAK
ncbi:MAG: transporter substrate-binding domain-containing protein [Lachnospiraceae bacterium]|nr:transporter substrate-binding domain-containing protein [Lachnospiraceae bacterium]